eukprot:11509385-Alexandrium_andersonii.AAC.1
MNRSAKCTEASSTRDPCAPKGLTREKVGIRPGRSPLSHVSPRAHATFEKLQRRFRQGQLRPQPALYSTAPA